MRTTLNIDDDLLHQAQDLSGLQEKTALIREGLKALIERESAKRLARLGGRAPVGIRPASSKPATAMILIDTSVWIDLHLFAAVALSGDTLLWTRDKRLAGLALSLGLGFSET